MAATMESKPVWVSDVTKMNARPVKRIFYVKNESDIIDAIHLANQNQQQISIAGQYHTMGGHCIIENGYLIDMKYMNRLLAFDKDAKTVTVQAGMMWSDLIRFLNEHGLSPKTLQSYSSFSIGGTISVNGHGITSDYSVSESIVDMRYIDANGIRHQCNSNDDIFSKLIGGYGLFGLITDVTLRVVPNTRLSMEYTECSVPEFYEKYSQASLDPKVGIKLGRINTTNFDSISCCKFVETESEFVSVLTDKPHEMSKPARLIYKHCMSSKIGQLLRYKVETFLGKPLDWSDSCEKNSLLYETAVPMNELYSPLIHIDRTHILQEFFIPDDAASFAKWMLFLKKTFVGAVFKNISLLNVTIRRVVQDKIAFLKYAPTTMLAFVFYYRVKRHESSNVELEILHNTLVEYVKNNGGTFYLPYRHHYSFQQMKQAYPNIDEFFDNKHAVDPKGIFSNMWYKHYCTTAQPVSLNTCATTMSSMDTTTHESLGIREIDNPCNRDRNSYKIIFSSDIMRYKFKEFLRNIFNLVNPDCLFDVIRDYLRDNPNASDLDVFSEIKYRFSKYIRINNGIPRIFSGIRILNNQRKDFVGQLKNIMNQIQIDGTTIDGLAIMGDCGRNVKLMRHELRIIGPAYVLHDHEPSYLDGIETNSLTQVGTRINFDYEKSTSVGLPEASVGMLTCMMGLHHFPIENLGKIIESIHSCIRPGGYFVFREHDCYPELMPIVNAAHNVFNAVTDVDIDAEKQEIRQFRSVNEWIRIVESYGFQDVGIYGMQTNDTTEDFMLCFRRLDTMRDQADKAINAHIEENKIEYVRSLDQTYSTLVEWNLVDVVKCMGKFMETTPYYSFPYWHNIKLFWWQWYCMASIIRQKSGFRKAYLSEYSVATIVMGVTTTLLFLLMMVLSYIPRKIYTMENNVAATQVCIKILHSKHQNCVDIDNNCQVLTSQPYDDDMVLSLVRVNRYVQFKESCMKFAHAGIIFHELCGQQFIQIKIIKARNSVIDIPNATSLIEYSILPNDEFIEAGYDVAVKKLHEVIRYCHENGIEITHIFDY